MSSRQASIVASATHAARLRSLPEFRSVEAPDRVPDGSP
jgi:hypothetical protein